MILKFLADMNISPITVELINSAGYDIVRDSQVLSKSSSDEDILQYSREHNFILLTQDLDFSHLIALGNLSKPSFITFRVSDNSPQRLAEIFLQIMNSIDIIDILENGSSITVNDRGIRIRQSPIHG